MMSQYDNICMLNEKVVFFLFRELSSSCSALRKDLYECFEVQMHKIGSLSDEQNIDSL